MEGREEVKGEPADGTLEDYVAMLRWGPARLRGEGRVYLKIAQIAKMVKVSPSKVRCLLVYARGDRPRQPQDRCGPPAKIQPHHVAFLTSMSTLQAQAACTLTERAVLFHRRFPELKITPLSIQRLYRMNGIRRKALRYVKTLKYQDPDRRQLDIHRMKTEIWQARAQGRRIIYADEAMFTRATLPSLGLAAKHHNVALEDKLTSNPALAVVAGVSAEVGLEAHHI